MEAARTASLMLDLNHALLQIFHDVRESLARERLMTAQRFEAQRISDNPAKESNCARRAGWGYNARSQRSKWFPSSNLGEGPIVRRAAQMVFSRLNMRPQS
jgi:hypothetical protein